MQYLLFIISLYAILNVIYSWHKWNTSLLSKIALLIDAENVSHRDLPRIMQEVSRFRRIVLRAVYADWHKPDLQTWLMIAQENDFRIRHQTSAATKIRRI